MPRERDLSAGFKNGISIKRGVALTGLGFAYFTSLFSLLNLAALSTGAGARFRHAYRLSVGDVLDITNKLVSAVQAALSCATGAIVCMWSCTRDFMRSSHFMSEAYAWFGAAYFFYDIWSMYMVSARYGVERRLVSAVQAALSCATGAIVYVQMSNSAEWKSRFQKRVSKNGELVLSSGDGARKKPSASFLEYCRHEPVILMHHLFIGGFGFLVIVKVMVELLPSLKGPKVYHPLVLSSGDGAGKKPSASFLEYCRHEPVILMHHLFIGGFGFLVIVVSLFDGELVLSSGDGARKKPSASFLEYCRHEPVILMHHLFIGGFGFLVIVYFRGSFGDCTFGFVYLMELSTPFVSLRGILSRLRLKASRLYLANGLAMLGSFLLCRVLSLPYACLLYARARRLPYLEAPVAAAAEGSRLYLANGLAMLGSFLLCRVLSLPYACLLYARARRLPYLEAVKSLPIGCKISICILLLPQLYWFYLMSSGAIKMLLAPRDAPSAGDAKHKRS
ncbi:uncharacterized protein LOC114360805 [Ostrinia furnacalis]|uniref:uncharacterized protein LOC114360805 n=1 Tax=Ostrinia furnacalis TaxID=93504 RepID=UPI00103E0DF6|nr:uncharacterized protein LOC114360805 [Ostrinia furnacalis]